MRPTERDLMVARAVRDALAKLCVDDHVGRANVERLLESLPEPAEHEQAAQDADHVALPDCRCNACWQELIAAARAEGARVERERCLRIVKSHGLSWCGDEGWIQACNEIAIAIRAEIERLKQQ